MSPVFCGEDGKWWYRYLDEDHGPFDNDEDAWEAYDDHVDDANND